MPGTSMRPPDAAMHMRSSSGTRSRVTSGGVLTGAPRLGELVHARLRAAANAPSLVGFDIVETSLGDHAGVLGAAAAITDKRIASGAY